MRNFVAALLDEWTTARAFPSPVSAFVRALLALGHNRITYGGWRPWGSDVAASSEPTEAPMTSFPL